MSLSDRTTRDKRRGVTLLEVLVVLAIMALIVGVAAPRLMDNFGRAKAQTAEVQMNNLRVAMQLYYLDVGQFPNEGDGLRALISEPSSANGWRGPYVDRQSDIEDPWGNEYLYRFPGEDSVFDIYSYGRDGQPGGSGEDSDLKL